MRTLGVESVGRGRSVGRPRAAGVEAIGSALPRSAVGVPGDEAGRDHAVGQTPSAIILRCSRERIRLGRSPIPSERRPSAGGLTPESTWISTTSAPSSPVAPTASAGPWRRRWPLEGRRSWWPTSIRTAPKKVADRVGGVPVICDVGRARPDHRAGARRRRRLRARGGVRVERRRRRPRAQPRRRRRSRSTRSRASTCSPTCGRPRRSCRAWSSAAAVTSCRRSRRRRSSPVPRAWATRSPSTAPWASPSGSALNYQHLGDHRHLPVPERREHRDDGPQRG